MKIDFRKIEVTDIEGNKSTFDISKELGNTIYQKTADLGELELAKRIYTLLVLYRSHGTRLY